MKKIIVISICLFAFISARTQSLSPEVISSAGDYYVSSNVTLSWTLGEPVIETFSSTGNILTQGFQQPTYSVTAIDDKPGSDGESTQINVYPNPATDLLNVDLISAPKDGLLIQMYDLNGKVIIDKQVQSTPAQKQLDVSRIARGNYILRFVSTNGKLLKTFKVVKN
jgi:hypothetical protein